MTTQTLPSERPLTPLLDTIASPAELKRLLPEQLPELCAQLREFLLFSVAQSGGHFAAGLGVVELTVALHYVFDTPHDRLLWDVGHQSYPHKILTGRREALPSIRRQHGLTPFTARQESSYDSFGTGHSSTSISAALGMALALQKNQDARQIVAIIGDGAMTAGMAFEALNHAGREEANVLVILNDNDMSISQSVSALNKYFGRMGAVPSNLFSELGFTYTGPIDGHDLSALLETFKRLQHSKGPQLLHVLTTKGKGFEPAEAAPIKYHALSRHNTTAPKHLTFSNLFGRWLCEQAENDPRLMAITPAMSEGSGLVEFSQRFPERFFDVAIAEQHALTLAAGMACEGSKPVVAIYSTFLQRAYDQLIHDIALQNLDVLLAIDRAGLVGEDGPTHHGAYDLSYLRCIPNLILMTPSDEQECWNMLHTGYEHPGPAAVRYPRGSGIGLTIEASSTEALPIGQGRLCRQGENVAILAFGPVLHAALTAAETLNATVADMRFVKPLDQTLILRLARTHELLVCVEDNAIAGGAGSAVLEVLAQAGIAIAVRCLGIPDEFIEHASVRQQHQYCGLDAQGIIDAVQQHAHVAPAYPRHH